MRQSASALYSEVLTNRDLGIALFIKCLVKGSLENEGLSFFVHLLVLLHFVNRMKNLYFYR